MEDPAREASKGHWTNNEVEHSMVRFAWETKPWPNKQLESSA